VHEIWSFYDVRKNGRVKVFLLFSFLSKPTYIIFLHEEPPPPAVGGSVNQSVNQLVGLCAPVLESRALVHHQSGVFKVELVGGDIEHPCHIADSTDEHPAIGFVNVRDVLPTPADLPTRSEKLHHPAQVHLCVYFVLRDYVDHNRVFKHSVGKHTLGSGKRLALQDIGDHPHQRAFLRTPPFMTKSFFLDSFVDWRFVLKHRFTLRSSLLSC
jgi:hypothetical protein